MCKFLRCLSCTLFPQGSMHYGFSKQIARSLMGLHSRQHSWLKLIQLSQKTPISSLRFTDLFNDNSLQPSLNRLGFNSFVSGMTIYRALKKYTSSLDIKFCHVTATNSRLFYTAGKHKVVHNPKRMEGDTLLLNF